MDDRLSTPVAFFIFNRRDTAARVFEAIRRARPERLLVVADGPRPGRAGEAEACRAARAVLEGVDWDCQVSTEYAQRNLGCRRRLVSGLDWVFGLTEEAIILEDDCLPSASFFPFCQELLARYRSDPRVMVISGDNFQAGRSRTQHSYYFSKYSHNWGWACWRRTWQLYDAELRNWPAYKRAGGLEAVCETRAERRYWSSRFDAVHAGRGEIWDYQLQFACWYHGGLTVLPDQNLVSNIGADAQATHQSLGDESTDNLPRFELGELRHPPRVERNAAADRFTFQAVYSGRLRRVARYLRRGFTQGGAAGLLRASGQLVRMSIKLLTAR